MNKNLKYNCNYKPQSYSKMNEKRGIKKKQPKIRKKPIETRKYLHDGILSVVSNFDFLN